MFSAGASKVTSNAQSIATLDAEIKHWADCVLPIKPLFPPNGQPLQRHSRYQILVYTRVSHLRLPLRRRLMVSLTYSGTDVRVCGEIVIEIVRQITYHSSEAGQASSSRFHMAVSLGDVLLILSTLLCGQRSESGLQDFKASTVLTRKPSVKAQLY